ncbi:MAG: hypothetical protein AB8F65_00860 [Woeseiaceae bacterium]
MATRSNLRMMMPVAGLVLLVAGALGLTACVRLLSTLIDQGGDRGLWFDYGLVAIALIAVVLAGASLIWSWLTDKQRDVIPGPALYLLGVSIVMLSSQVVILGGYLIGLAGVLVGIGIMVLEYRSDWL